MAHDRPSAPSPLPAGDLYLLAKGDPNAAPVLVGIADPATGEVTVTGTAAVAAHEPLAQGHLGYYLKPFSLAAEHVAAPVLPPGELHFQVGQLIYQDGAIAELRLQCTTRSNDGQEATWETPTPPRLTIEGSEGSPRLVLHAEDQGRTHFSATIVHAPDGTQTLLLLWDLRANLPEEASVAHRAGSDSLPLPPPPQFNVEPVPLPHRAILDAAPLTTLRGLGRNLVPAAYQDTPDLDRLTSKIALGEAQASLWHILEHHLSKATDSLSPPGSWERSARGVQTVYAVRGLQEADVRALWDRVKASLNVSDGGPGLQAVDPAFVPNNRFDTDTRRTVIETALTFWPEASLTYQDGYPKPGVSYRSNQSPGYLALLERHGEKPFKADGWLWIPRGNVREGYRLAGRAEYLFQEGVQAIKALEQALLDRHSREIEELQEAMRNTLPFPDTVATNQEMMEKLKADIRRAKDHLATLSTFDCLNPLKCVLYAFHTQREAWAREELGLPSGKVIKTAPYRVIRLDPQELKYYLNATGDMWRTLLWRRLQPLTAFERTTWTSRGRAIETGDRFIHLLIDGFRSADELDAPDRERGLWKVLRQGGGVPSDAFFVVLSPDFIDRCYAWERDTDGRIVFGARAAAVKAAQATHRIEAHAIRQKERRRSATYADSKRLTALSERERWSAGRKLLVTRIAQGRTVNATHTFKAGRAVKLRSKNELGGNYLLRKVGGKLYEVCRGTGGRGYTVGGWMKMGGYALDKERHANIATYREFLQDLHYFVRRLGLHLQIPGISSETSEVLKHIEEKRCRKVLPLHLDILLPTDIEARLQAILDAPPPPPPPPPTPSPEPPKARKVVDKSSVAEIRTQLAAAGIRQGELADILGVSRESVNRWFSESNPKRLPDDRAKQIMAILRTKSRV